MHFKLFCYAARPACMNVGILMSVRMEMSSLICTLYIFTKAEENCGYSVMQFPCIAKNSLKHVEDVILVACIQCFHSNEAPPISKQCHKSKTPPTYAYITILLTSSYFSL